MANPRALDKRRKSIRNIRKITRTMELIATARFRKAMDRAVAASAYAKRMTRLVADVTRSGVEVSHPLLEPRDPVARATLLVLTANRGLCGGFNANVIRAGFERWNEMKAEIPRCTLEVSGKQRVVVETLLPLASIEGVAEAEEAGQEASLYEFLPSSASILEEVVPASFKVRLFNCFLDAAVSEQIARMVAMKAATENADELIRHLSMRYNRARQGRITSELTDLIGGVEALQ